MILTTERTGKPLSLLKRWKPVNCRKDAYKGSGTIWRNETKL